MELKIGRLATFHSERSFGFIEEVDGNRWFCHLLDFNGMPVPAIGTPVAFTIGTYRGKPKATKYPPGHHERNPGRWPMSTLELVTEGINALFRSGDVVEVRVRGKRYGRSGINAVGYFNDFAKMAEAITACGDNPAPRGYSTNAVYYTMNSVDPALLARAYNHMQRDAQESTSDKDIIKRTHFLIDCDPVRPAEISSSDAEQEAAMEHAAQIRDDLTRRGWPAPIEADSGNGSHLIYDVDIPNNDASRNLIKACLASLASRFDDERVHIDRSVYNAARITKSYGSMSRKGDDVPSRPHRRSRILVVPRERRVVSLELLQSLAAEAPISTLVASQQSSDGTVCPPEKFEQQLALVGITHSGAESYEGGWLWKLDHCVFDPSHVRTSVIVGIRANGAMYYHCSHNSCTGLGWKEFRAEVERKTLCQALERVALQYKVLHAMLLGVLKRLLKIFAALGAIGILAFAALFVFLWWEHTRSLVLPAPTGNFAVGRATYTWVNDAASDALSPSGTEKETVIAWIWYPASLSAESHRSYHADYFPSAWQAALAHRSGVLMTDFLTRDLVRVQIHSVPNAAVSHEQTSYPVVIMRAGASAFTADYTVLAEDLASHGYIVVGLDAPYRTFLVVLPDGRVIERVPTANLDLVNDSGARLMAEKLLPMWMADIDFALLQLQQLNNADPTGRFTGRFDFQRLGAFGHSFGGAQALQFCHEDSRCRAAIDLDGIPFGSVVHDGLSKPGMILLSDHSREMDGPATKEIFDDFRSIYARLPSGYFVTVHGANHFTFSDQILLKSRLIVFALMAVRTFGHLEPHRGLAITTDYVHTFFDVYVNGAPPSQLAKLAAKYPEVQAESH